MQLHTYTHKIIVMRADKKNTYQNVNMNYQFFLSHLFAPQWFIFHVLYSHGYIINYLCLRLRLRNTKII